MGYITREHLRHVGGDGGSRSPMKAEHIEQAVRSGASGGTAFLIGIVHGRQGGMPSLGPVPADLAVAIAMHGLALGLPMAGVHLPERAVTALHGSGDGALAYFLGAMGANVGQKMRKSAGKMQDPPQPPTNRAITQGFGSASDYRQLAAAQAPVQSYSPAGLYTALYGRR